MAIINVPEPVIPPSPPFVPEFKVVDHGEQSGSYSTISYIVNGIEYVEEDLTKQRDRIQMTYLTTYQFESKTLQVYCNGLEKTAIYDFEEMGGMSFVFIERTAKISKWLKPDGIIKVKYVKKTS